MGDFWYFAYGSNLDPDQIAKRTNHAGEIKLCWVEGYKINFNKRSMDGTGKANITPQAGGKVWGVMYQCDERFLSEMDMYEGVSGGHYVRIHLLVQCTGEPDVNAITYTAGQSFIAESLFPSNAYLDTILRGARHHGFPAHYISEIEKAAR
jgi:cation transport regulator ChaC